MNAVTDWNLVRTFLTVAEHLHRADAARRLGISVRTLTRHVHQLEAELGVVLLVRSRNRTELTPAGLWLRDALSRPLSEANDALLESHLHATPALRIAITTEVPARWNACVGTWAADPDTTGRLELQPNERAQQRLRAGDLDLALIAGEPVDVPGRIVGDEPAVVVFPDDHPAAARPAIRPGDLADLPVAIGQHTKPDIRRRRLLRLQGDPDARSVLAPPLATIGQGLLQAARIHRAAAVILEAVAAQSDTTGLAVRPLDPPLRVPISLAARPDLASAVVASLAEHLRTPPDTRDRGRRACIGRASDDRVSQHHILAPSKE